MIIMALCMMAPMAQAELTKKQIKKIEKNAKSMTKELKKEGFSVVGSQPLEASLIKHYTLLEEGATDQSSVANTKTKNAGRRVCLSQAMIEYATKELSVLDGEAVDELVTDQVDPKSAEFSKFNSTFHTKVQAEIQGEIQESCTVCKQLPDGTYEFRMFCTVDPEKAAQARRRAIRNAAIEAGYSDEVATKMSDYLSKVAD